MFIKYKTWFILQSIIIIFIIHTAFAAEKDDLKPDSAKECAICHYSWVDTFFVEHRGSELASLPERPTAADAEMCYSCHDGSTVDSRKQIINDRRHQTGIQPSEKIKIPEIFPLDEEGRMDCATCHSAHGVSTEPGIEKTIFLRTPNEDSEMCRMCHTDTLGGPEKGHHPLDKTTLKISAELIKYGGVAGTKPNQVICESCHVAHGGFTDKRLVLPIDRPQAFPVLCEMCHGKTPGLNKDRNKNRFSHSVDVTPDNAKIPEKWKNGFKVKLGAGGELVCVSCHTTHNSTVNKYLLCESNEKDALCLQCHSSQEKLIRGTKHDLNLMAPDAVNVKQETVSQSGPCSCCHLTHEGVGPFMWARQWKGTEETPVGICKSCHAKQACADEVPVPETGHPIGMKPDESTKAMDFPLFTAFGKKDLQGAIYCSSCHNSHQWDPENPENKGSKDIKGDITNSFLRVAHQGSGLCLGCHKEEAAIEKTGHDLSHSAPQEKNILGQLPEESGVCGSCHLAHGGNELLMWGRNLDMQDSRLMARPCLECHKEGSCGKENLIGEHSHPIEIRLADPSVTKLPLFTSEGKKDPDGMVFCSTCHNTHQWDPRDPEKKGEDGTSSDSFLRQAVAGSSQLCRECHENKAYIDGTDHDLRLTAADDKNKQGLLPQDSGLCGPCHAVHNAVVQPFIWNRDVGPAVVANWKKEFSSPNNFMTGFCSSCHMQGQCAENKIPEYGLHPRDLYMAMAQEKSGSMSQEEYEKFLDQFPIFTDEGEKSVKGDIVCVTCHDPHLWNASHQQHKGPGKEIEGNATNSFLREKISFTLCSSCHGEDALYMFKYFHALKGRIKQEPIKEEGKESEEKSYVR